MVVAAVNFVTTLRGSTLELWLAECPWL